MKGRSITQPRVILITPSPSLNGGIFGASEPYNTVSAAARICLPFQRRSLRLADDAKCKGVTY